MAVRLSKPWMAADLALQHLRGNLGVFELADGAGQVIYIGCANAGQPFGLKSAVAAALVAVPEASQVRFEVTQAYHTRYQELLMAYQADHDALPPAQPPLAGSLGRLSPA